MVAAMTLRKLILFVTAVAAAWIMTNGITDEWGISAAEAAATAPSAILVPVLLFAIVAVFPAPRSEAYSQ